MLKTLLSVDADLGSSIAVRYMRELSNYIEMDLHGIHVIDPEKLGHAPGSGWVRRTWENTIIDTERGEITRFLNLEKTDPLFLKMPRVLIGERTDTLLEEMHMEEYDLFIEGVLPTSNAADFQKLIHSRLYRLLPCPVLVVKNLLTPSSVAVLFDEHTDALGFAKSLSMIVKKAKFTIVPVYLKFTGSKDSVLTEVAATDLPLQGFIQSNVKTSNLAKVIEGSPEAIAQRLREYGALVSYQSHTHKKNDKMLDLLSRAACPVLICWH